MSPDDGSSIPLVGKPNNSLDLDAMGYLYGKCPKTRELTIKGSNTVIQS